MSSAGPSRIHYSNRFGIANRFNANVTLILVQPYRARVPDVAYPRTVTAEQKSRLDEALWTSPLRMSGTPCFRGTRVPVQSLIDFLESGETVDAFIKLYPPITRDQVFTVLDFANSKLLECAFSLTSA